MRKVLSSRAGFSLIDLIAVVALLGIVAAIGFPVLTAGLERQRLGQAAREVERELNAAKQRAIGNNRSMRLRFNCPTPGVYRIVELVGSPRTPAVDDAPSSTTRCDLTRFPYPAADRDPATRPNLDGPPRYLDSRVSFTTVRTIEFWPDGTAHWDTGSGSPWPTIPVAGTTLTLTRGARVARSR